MMAMSRHRNRLSALGPDTIRLRVALTEAVASSPVLDSISSYLPQARLVSSILTLGSDSKAFVGAARAGGDPIIANPALPL